VSVALLIESRRFALRYQSGFNVDAHGAINRGDHGTPDGNFARESESSVASHHGAFLRCALGAPPSGATRSATPLPN